MDKEESGSPCRRIHCTSGAGEGAVRATREDGVGAVWATREDGVGAVRATREETLEVSGRWYIATICMHIHVWNLNTL